MPGSIITCQGLSTVYNSYYGIANAASGGNPFLGLTIDAATDTFNVDSAFAATVPFPFQTGDVVYYGTSSNITLVTRYFAIRLSATSIKVATSYANAINGIAVDLTTNSTNTNFAHYQHQISNAVLMVHTSDTMGITNYFNKDLWQSSSFSTLNFGITENIAFDFTIENYGMCGIQTVSGSYGIGVGAVHGNAIIGRETTGTALTNRFWYAFSLGTNLRIRIQSSIITIQRKETNGSYTTIYTTTTITNTERFRFFAYFSLNNTKLSNCIITYL